MHRHATDSGLKPVGELTWGDHFCHFYRTEADLAETLIPYFKAGLERNESCLWVASDPFPADRAVGCLRQAVPDFDRRLASGQIEIHSHQDWYLRQKGMRGADVLAAWAERAERATAKGYGGLRLSGNTAWLDATGWDDFMAYERAVSAAFRQRRIIALCSYSLCHCCAESVLDVVQAHDFALSRRKGEWQTVESASLKHAKRELATLNAELEDRVIVRTTELERAVAHQRFLLDELNHRVKNTLASVQAIVSRTLARCADKQDAMRRIEGRIQALARVHSLLSVDRWSGASVTALADAELAPYNGRIQKSGPDIWLTPRTALALSLALHELATNAVKYGALSCPTGVVQLSVDQQKDRLGLVWRESGGPAVMTPASAGFGTQLIRLLTEHDLGGRCNFEYAKQGLMVTLTIPIEPNDRELRPH